MLKLIVGTTLITVLTFALPAFAQDASPEEVIELMEISGMGGLGEELVNELMPELKAMLPDAPPRFWQEVRNNINTAELIEKIIPIYQKLLTSADIQAILKFYDTPVGRKLLSVQGQVSAESYYLGQEWGQFIVEQVVTKYEREIGPLQ
ncbi:MAG: DUF2059 domain-containing protein [Candidatus Omnitrophica bacterium]|nr:DUF2059 domain-containing protein [Candidatus Omnitrophota bacterium]MCB9720488.1 DUF2059 domain-containing protein [Candidatus Omnitrophota bacterium]